MTDFDRWYSRWRGRLRAVDGRTLLRKVKAFGAKIPFIEDVLAAWYCALDPATPARVKAVLMAAIAYFVLPADMVPDVVVGLGFTDDAAVMAAAITAVSRHIRPRHRQAARATLRNTVPNAQ